MNCEDCLGWIEEYFDGEVDERNKSRMDSHLSACVSCSAAYQELVSEQQFLVEHYQPEVSVSERAWANVWSGYRGASSPAPVTLFERLSKFSFPSLRFAGLQAAAAAVVIILIGGVYFLSQRGTGSGPKEEAHVAATGNENRASSQGIGQENGQPRQGAGAVDVQAPNSRGTRVARISHPRGRGWHGSEGLVAAKKPFDSDNAPVNIRAIKHIENVQLVLRSFRNQSAGEGDEELDVSYANQMSKKLLQVNKELQQEMKDKGDLRSETVLSSVAPFLSEIAALPDRVSRAQAHRIEEQLQREGVVAALPVFATVSLAAVSNR